MFYLNIIISIPWVTVEELHTKLLTDKWSHAFYYH